MEANELYLLQKLKEGDIKALEIIFSRYYAGICNYLLLLFKNQLIVEHIAQDIFVYIWENRETLEIKTSIESYLYSAGKYKGLNYLRNAKRRETINENIRILQENINVSSDTILEAKELEQIIENAIVSLPPRCQQIFRLSREDEMSYAEIAKFLDISVNTVEGQIGIALKKLRAVLRPFYFRLFLLA
ncbi:MAG: RNA polymerase sigma-70 factor [Bacteroidales bacterium]